MNKIPVSKYIKPLGRYIYKNLGGAYSISTTPNSCDIYFLVLYTENDSNDVQEMRFDLNLASYSNKLRVNIIAIDKSERTIAFDVYDGSILEDYSNAKEIIWQKAKKRISKAFAGYNFIFE